MTVKISVSMDDSLTLGDLYTFVDSARASGKPPSELVTQVEVPGLEQVIDRLETEVTQVGSRGCFIDGEDAARYANVLRQVLDSDGDARGALIELGELFDALTHAA